jgi:hypothetical protein
MARSGSRLGPVFAFAVVAAAAVGYTAGQALDRGDQHTVTGVATLADAGDGLTMLTPGDGHLKIAFDARSVDWYDARATFHDGVDGRVPSCLHAREPARVEASYVDVGDQTLVAWVKCLR